MDFWGKANIAAVLIVAIVIASILGYTTNLYIQTEKSKVFDQRSIDIALNILRQNPNNNNINTRRWAVKIINHYSTIRINSASQQELIHKIKIDDNSNSELIEMMCKGFKQSMEKQ